MKHAFTKIILLVIIASSSALAMGAGNALVTKISSPGYVLADASPSKECQVYTNRVVINRTYGYLESSLTTTETKVIRINSDIRSLLTLAQTSSVRSESNILCDAPSMSIKANLDRQEFTLFDSGGCGRPRQLREGGAAKVLMDLVNTYCPNTFDDLSQ